MKSGKLKLKKILPLITVLIVDTFALYFEENCKFALLFNNTHIGGFLVPICDTCNTKQKNIAKSRFNDFRRIRVLLERAF